MGAALNRQLRCGLLVLAAGCVQSAGHAPPFGAAPPAASDDSPADAGASDATADGAVATVPKAPLAGLIDMQEVSWHNTAGAEPTFTMANVDQFPGVLGGIVINATWDAIQPTADGALDFTTIDAALAQIREYNAANPSAPLGSKLRVYAGANAPAWAKALDGDPVSISRNAQACASCGPLTIGRIWSPTYIAAWRQFQQQLAARYDTEPLVRHVAVTSCGQQTDEPFVPTTDDMSKTRLSEAGYTDELQQDCLLGAVDDYAPWLLTNVDYTINPFTPIRGKADDTVFPESVMAACRAALGARCVLGNHALSAPLRAADQGVYDALGAAGGPISFQTASPRKMGCLWTQTVAQGVALGASSIEIWPRAALVGFDSLTADDLRQLAAELVTPIAVDPDPMPLPDTCTGFH